MSRKPAVAASSKALMLRLYTAGATPHSVRAVKNITRICEQYCKDDYQLEVIDIHQQPELAKSEQIIAAPTLIKYAPEPMRRLVGDLSDTATVLNALGLAEGLQ